MRIYVRYPHELKSLVVQSLSRVQCDHVQRDALTTTFCLRCACSPFFLHDVDKSGLSLLNSLSLDASILLASVCTSGASVLHIIMGVYNSKRRPCMHVDCALLSLCTVAHDH